MRQKQADPAAAGVSGCGQAVREAVEGVPSGREGFEARRGEGDTSWFAAEQRVADLALQALDLLAGGGWAMPGRVAAWPKLSSSASMAKACSC